MDEQGEFVKQLKIVHEKEASKKARDEEISRLRAENSAETAEEQRQLQMKIETVNCSFAEQEQQNLEWSMEMWEDDKNELIEHYDSLITEVWSEMYDNENENSNTVEQNDDVIDSNLESEVEEKIEEMLNLVS